MATLYNDYHSPFEVGILGLLAFIFGLDYIWVTPLGIWRPVVAGTITGIILGDPITGLIVGSLLEFVFAGLFTIGGGTVPEAELSLVAIALIGRAIIAALYYMLHRDVFEGAAAPATPPAGKATTRDFLR